MPDRAANMYPCILGTGGVGPSSFWCGNGTVCSDTGSLGEFYQSLVPGIYVNLATNSSTSAALASSSTSTISNTAGPSTAASPVNSDQSASESLVSKMALGIGLGIGIPLIILLAILILRLRKPATLPPPERPSMTEQQPSGYSYSYPYEAQKPVNPTFELQEEVPELATTLANAPVAELPSAGVWGKPRNSKSGVKPPDQQPRRDGV
jgi:hypothetical protein